MEQLILSESDGNCRYIAYIAGAVARAGDTSAEICLTGGRIALRLRAESLAAVRGVAEEKIAEAICIGYKYALMRRDIHPAGLSAEEREILLAAIIAADFADDKKYVLARLETGGECAVDGFFRFRLQGLRKKWAGVAACVPEVFTGSQLAEFMEFLLGACRGKVFLKGGDVFDSRCRRLRRSSLIDGGKSEMNTLREIVLSCAGKVECLTLPSARQENFLRRYYAGRVGFFS